MGSISANGVCYDGLVRQGSPSRDDRTCVLSASTHSTNTTEQRAVVFVERVMGIGPTLPAWKAGILPLNYTRKQSFK